MTRNLAQYIKDRMEEMTNEVNQLGKVAEILRTSCPSVARFVAVMEQRASIAKTINEMQEAMADVSED